MSFALTKIQTPTIRAELIARPALEARLQAALATRQLVLLVAAAGHGKTAALSRQLRALPAGTAVAWVTASAEDDLPRFLSCLIAALAPYDPPWRVAPRALVDTVLRERGVRMAAALFVEALRAMPVARGVLAVDDLHFVADPVVFEFLGALLDAWPQGWTMAIATRLPPPLGVARRRAQGVLAEFNHADLRLSHDEIRHLSRLLHADDSAAAAQQLLERTGGWPAGVCLNLIGADGAGAPQPRARHDQRRMFDYLASEVFAQLPQALREFLLRCAVLAELNPERCATVSGSTHAYELLEEIDRRGLFVSVLDSPTLTLRLHDLFRDFLQHRLRRERPDEYVPLLHRAAQTEPDPIRRVRLLLRASAWPESQQLLLDLAAPLMAAGRGAELRQLAALFPVNIRAASAHLAYVEGIQAWHQFADQAVRIAMHAAERGFAPHEGDWAACARLFQAISTVFSGRKVEAPPALPSAAPGAAPRLEVAALSELFAFWRAGYFGPAAGPARHLGALVDLLLAHHAPAGLWYQCIPRLYLLIGRPGVGAAMERFVRGALDAAGDEHEPLQASCKILDAWLALWRGQLSRANAVIEQLMAQSQWLGQPMSLRVPLLRVLAAYHAIRGDRDAVRELCAALLADDIHPMNRRMWRINLVSLRGRLAAAVDDYEAAFEALRELQDPLVADDATILSPVIATLRARWALHERRDTDARAMLRDVVARAADVDRMGLNASARIFLAVAELRCGEPAAAWQALEPLLAGLHATEEIGGMLLSGTTMLRELAQSPWHGHAPEAALAATRRWLEVSLQWRNRPSDLRSLAAPPDPPPLRPQEAQLSARELEVLSLVAAGHSNKLIARALQLSPHTVKRHVARILQRLQVSSRIQAAAWFRQGQASRVDREE